MDPSFSAPWEFDQTEVWDKIFRWIPELVVLGTEIKNVDTKLVVVASEFHKYGLLRTSLPRETDVSSLAMLLKAGDQLGVFGFCCYEIGLESIEGTLEAEKKASRWNRRRISFAFKTRSKSRSTL